MIPIRKAFLWILLSTIAISGSATLAWYYVVRFKHFNEGEGIRLLLQTVHGGDPLDVNFLSGVVGLSEDHPIPLNRFDVRAAKEKLQLLPMVKQAKVSLVPPNALHLELILREPRAYLGDYYNTALDLEGKAFPLYPHYTPKTLPVFFLGEANVARAWDLLNTLESFGLKVKAIDLTRASDLSFGRREIIVWLDESHTKEEEGHLEFVVCRVILRLDPDHVESALADYRLLRSTLEMNEPLLTIDLRVADLAFIKSTQ